MKTKKALGGLLGLLGSLAFFDCLVPVPAPLRFNLTNKKSKTLTKKLRSNKLTYEKHEYRSRKKNLTGYRQVWHRKQLSAWWNGGDWTSKRDKTVREEEKGFFESEDENVRNERAWVGFCIEKDKEGNWKLKHGFARDNEIFLCHVSDPRAFELSLCFLCEKKWKCLRVRGVVKCTREREYVWYLREMTLLGFEILGIYEDGVSLMHRYKGNLKATLVKSVYLEWYFKEFFPVAQNYVVLNFYFHVLIIKWSIKKMVAF